MPSVLGRVRDHERCPSYKLKLPPMQECSSRNGNARSGFSFGLAALGITVFASTQPTDLLS
jgi:hypothetical protein